MVSERKKNDGAEWGGGVGNTQQMINHKKNPGAMDGLKGKNILEWVEEKVDQSGEKKSKLKLNQNNGGVVKRQ